MTENETTKLTKSFKSRSLGPTLKNAIYETQKVLLQK
jgi:hypothetical protein